MEVSGYTAERMKAIEDASVVNGEVDPVTGHLHLIRFDESVIDAGPFGIYAPLMDTVANLATNNPIVTAGRMIIATDSSPRIFAVGDGVTGWNSLVKYAQGYPTVICTSGTRPASPFTGMEIYETDTGRKLIRTPGGNWARVGYTRQAGFTGALLAKTQSIPDNSGTLVTGWGEAWDTDGFYSGSGGNIVIPAGFSGVYSVVYSDDAAVGPYTRRFSDLAIAGVNYRAGMQGEDFFNASPTVFLSAGATISVTSYQLSGAARSIAFRLEITLLHHMPEA